jgi:hypothetical protein
MPLRDHFTPPLSVTRPWEGFHTTWATTIAQELNRILPPEYVAIPQTSRGPLVEVDVAALELAAAGRPTGATNGWTPTAPGWTAELDWTARDLFEVRVIDQRDGPRLAGAVDLVSPANKDRPAARRAFAGKCAGYLRAGVGVVVCDPVTTRHQGLHAELLELLELDPSDAATAAPLYAVAYRTEPTPTARLDVWPHPLAIGAPLPTLPLWLTSELAVPVDLEASYEAACRLLRIGGG